MMSKKIFYFFLFSVLFNSSLVYSQENEKLPRFKKVIYVIFENAGVSEVMKNPIFKETANKNVFFSNFYAETRPSQPNYFAMVAGSDFDINTNGNVNLDYTHIGDLLEAQGLDWRAVAEDYPGNCFTGATSKRYARKHAPFISFNNVRTNPARCAKITSEATFLQDWKAGKLPAFTYYSPHMDNDGHDSSVAFAADWFQGAFLDEIQQNPGLLNDTLLFITFDEGNKFGSNQIYNVIMGNNIKSGLTVSEQLDHYSLLKMIEDEWNLGNLGRHDQNAATIPNIFK